MIRISTLASSSRGNCYHVTDGVTPLLLECGISINQILKGLEFGMSALAGCLVTHEHKDHCKAIYDVMKFGVNVYASRGTFEAIGRIIGPWNHRASIAQDKQQFTIGTWAILPFAAEHDAAEPLGFLLANAAGDKLLYATDTYYIRYSFQGLTHLMLEVNHSYEILNRNVSAGVLPVEMKKRLIRSHFSLENVKEFLRSNDLRRVREIHLIHLSDGNSDAELFKREIQGLTGKPVYVAEEKVQSCS